LGEIGIDLRRDQTEGARRAKTDRQGLLNKLKGATVLMQKVDMDLAEVWQLI
jgi:hypothetical protein